MDKGYGEMMNKKTLMMIAMMAVLVACADSPLGFGKSPPNEFLILTYPPLTVPPNIALRAPADPQITQETSPDARARRLIYGLPPKIRRNLSASEKAFLKRLGVDRAQIDIRAIIAKDRGLALYPEAITKKIMRQQ